MKTTLRIVSVVLGTSLLLAGLGCHKQASANNAPKSLHDSVSDMCSVLATANAEVLSNLNHNVTYNIRYSNYAKAEAALEQIASDASLNDQQKKAVNEVSELLKQAMANAQNPAPPAK